MFILWVSVQKMNIIKFNSKQKKNNLNDKIDLVIPLKYKRFGCMFMSVILCKYALDMSNIFVLQKYMITKKCVSLRS